MPAFCQNLTLRKNHLSAFSATIKRQIQTKASRQNSYLRKDKVKNEGEIIMLFESMTKFLLTSMGLGFHQNMELKIYFPQKENIPHPPMSFHFVKTVPLQIKDKLLLSFKYLMKTYFSDRNFFKKISSNQYCIIL